MDKQQAVVILRLIAKGHSYAQIVDSVPGVTYKHIFAAAAEAIGAMEGMQSKRKTDIKTIRQTYQRAYEPWGEEEDAKLEALHNDGRTPSQIAEQLGRQPGAIRARIRKLKLEVG